MPGVDPRYQRRGWLSDFGTMPRVGVPTRNTDQQENGPNIMPQGVQDALGATKKGGITGSPSLMERFMGFGNGMNSWGQPEQAPAFSVADEAAPRPAFNPRAFSAGDEGAPRLPALDPPKEVGWAPGMQPPQAGGGVPVPQPRPNELTVTKGPVRPPWVPADAWMGTEKGMAGHWYSGGDGNADGAGTIVRDLGTGDSGPKNGIGNFLSNMSSATGNTSSGAMNFFKDGKIDFGGIFKSMFG